MANFGGNFGQVVPASSTAEIWFTTNSAAGAAVAPLSAFEAGDVKLYKDHTATPRSSTSGWTMTSPINSVVGQHQLSIDLSDNTDAGFYAAGHVYTAILNPDTETVDGQTVVSVVGQFSIGVDLSDTVRAGLTALPNVAAGANGGVPLVGTQVPNATAEATGGLHSAVVRGGTAQSSGNTTSAIKLDSGASATADAYKGMIVRILSGTGAGSYGVVSSYNASTKVATISGTWKFATPDNTSVFVVLDYGLGAILDEVITGAVHNVQNSLAQFVRNAGGGGAIAIRTGTAQTGSTSTTIKLDSGASATNNVYNNMTVVITGGTGLGQTRTIISYNGTTKVATVAGAWVTTPDNTSTFALYAAPTSLVSDQGVAQAGAAGSLTLAATASATTSIYVGSFLTITGGTNAGETRVITAYNGGTKVATVDTNWSVTPDSTSTYAVIPAGNTAADSGPTPPTLSDIQHSILSDVTPFAGANIDAAITSRLAPTVAGRTLDVNATGGAEVDMTQAVPTSNTVQTVGDALNAARAGGFGKWVLTGTALTLYAADGSTVVHTFTLDSATVPTQRV